MKHIGIVRPLDRRKRRECGARLAVLDLVGRAVQRRARSMDRTAEPLALDFFVGLARRARLDGLRDPAGTACPVGATDAPAAGREAERGEPAKRERSDKQIDDKPIAAKSALERNIASPW